MSDDAFLITGANCGLGKDAARGYGVPVAVKLGGHAGHPAGSGQ